MESFRELLAVAAGAGVVLAAGSGAAAHIEEFEVEVADWFLTDAALQSGGVSFIDTDGEHGDLIADGSVGPIVLDGAGVGTGGFVQFLLEGHIHGTIHEGQVFQIEYDFQPSFSGGAVEIVGGQLSVESDLGDDGSLYGDGSVTPGAAMFGIFQTTPLEHIGGPIVGTHDGTEAGFIFALNLHWTGAAPGDLLSLTGSVSITPIPAPGAVGAGCVLAWGAGCARARRRR